MSSNHFVQFYEESHGLVEEAGQFLLGAGRAGDALLVVATADHRIRFEDYLESAGVAVAEGRKSGQFRFLDARETLSEILLDEAPDERRFRDVIGREIRRARLTATSGRVAVFGEMVALLWSERRGDAAIRLERLWNDLGKVEDFSLFCAYPMNGFEGERFEQTFETICTEHSDVLPSEEYKSATNDFDRHRIVARLRQKAASLEQEVRHRQAMQTVLLRREQELADFLDNAAVGLHQVGPEGIILWANRAELELLGYRRDEYVGHHISEFHADRSVIEVILSRLLRGETVVDEPARLRCKDGSIRHVRIDSNSLWEDGRFVHSRCFTRDCTDRVRLEEERRKRMDELAEADRRKNEFLGMLGHELRNPLSAIVLAVSRARSSNGEAAGRALEIIARQSKRLTRLVNDLLDVSRITRGAIELRMETVALSDALEGAVEQARPLIEERSHRLTRDLPQEPILLRADPARLEQIFGNLLVNAARYTNPGGEIRLVGSRDGDHAVISVYDNGIGLTEDARSRVFELFVRLRGSTQRDSSGLGVGLALVRQLVTLHGGTVEAFSEGPGCGSEFRVSLPLASPESGS